VVIRKWVDIPIEFELRGFVYDNRLTGLCQYFNDAFFPGLAANKAEVRELCQATFAQIRDKLPIRPQEYVIDFAVDLEGKRAYVIELNPFGKPNGMGTGTVMFDNHEEGDLRCLFGEREFEFRIEGLEAMARAESMLKKVKDPWKSVLVLAGYDL